MNEYELKNILEQRMVPTMAFVVYKNNKNSDVYVESHDINDKGKMLAGKPMTQECIMELVESFSVEQSGTPHGVVPDNMLYFDTRKGHEKFIWYNPPGKRMMFFKKDLNIEDREYYLPGIVYATNGINLNVYAFKEEVINKTSSIYKAPLFNVTDERVCLGSSRLEFPENPTFHSYIEYWEKKFWLTEFSHLGGMENPTKHSLVVVTKKSTESFDCNELKLFKINNKPLTLKDLLK